MSSARLFACVRISQSKKKHPHARPCGFSPASLRDLGAGGPGWSIRLCLATLLLLAAASHVRATTNPAPYIVTVSPAGVAAGTTNVTLTIQGGGFISSSVAQWNGLPLATTFVNATKLTATVPNSLVFGAGTAAITVLNGILPSNISYLPVGQPLASINLVAGASVTVGNTPLTVASGDFNGDGIPDLAVANSSDNTVSILLGNGDGTFTVKSTPSTGSFPYYIAVADFNGDGKADLAIANWNDNTVSILLGNGDGTFTAQTPVPTAESPAALAVGDFNSDGNLDLAVACANSSTLSILLGNGDGTFTAGASPAGGGNPRHIVAGDFNEDGFLDLAVSDSSATNVTLLLGNGNGTFQTPTAISTGSISPFTIVTADFNNDGHLDLAVSSGPQIEVLLGDGTGSFTANPTITVGTGAFNFVNALGVGDFNGDGKVDIVAFDETPPFIPPFPPTPAAILVLPGNGDGTFGTAASFPANGFQTQQIAVADFTNDGELDLAVPGGSTSVATYIETLPVALSPASVSFAAEDIGATSAPTNVTLTNNSAVTLTVTGVSIAGSTSAEFLPTNGCTSVPAAGTCTISVAFNATASGSQAAALMVVDSDPSSPQRVALTGIGIQTVPNVSLSAPSLSFSPQTVGTTSAAQSVTLSVPGSVGLTIGSIAVTGANSGDFHESDNCGSNVAAGAQCSINVSFTPTAVGSRVGAVTITDNAAGSPETVSLSGSGTQAPTYSLTGPESPVSATSGSTAKIKITVMPQGGAYDSAVAMSVSGLPSGATAVFSSPTVTPGSAGASTTMSVTFPASTTAAPQGTRRIVPSPIAMVAFLCLLFCLGTFTRRERVSQAMAAIIWVTVLASSAAMLGGCGAASVVTPPTTQTQKIVLTVTGKSGSLESSTKVTIDLM